jgi:hypothetical protein
LPLPDWVVCLKLKATIQTVAFFKNATVCLFSISFFKNITMNPKFTPFINAVRELTQPVKDRSKIAAFAIGYAAGCNIDLPSSELTDPSAHYDVNIAQGIGCLVSEFNECIVVDTVSAMVFARSFWLLRYEAVHRCPRMDQIPGNFFYSVFGVANFFSDADVDFLNTHSKDINTVYHKVCRIIEQKNNDQMALDIAVAPNINERS